MSYVDVIKFVYDINVEYIIMVVVDVLYEIMIIMVKKGFLSKMIKFVFEEVC